MSTADKELSTRHLIVRMSMLRVELGNTHTTCSHSIFRWTVVIFVTCTVAWHDACSIKINNTGAQFYLLLAACMRLQKKFYCGGGNSIKEEEKARTRSESAKSISHKHRRDTGYYKVQTNLKLTRD